MDITNDGGVELNVDFKAINKEKWISFLSSLRLYEALLSSKTEAALGTATENHWRYPHLKWENTYRSITGTIQRTALRDLDEMVQKGLLVKSAGRGRSTAYRLSPNPDTHRTIRTFRKPDITRTNRTLPKPAKDVPQPKPAMRRATVSRQGKTNTKKNDH